MAIPRPMASVQISFGLVTVPVQIFTSSEGESRISFNWIHAKCGNRIKQQYYCPEDDQVIERSDMVKGYAFQKGKFVLFTQEELKAMESKGTGTIDIVDFVPADQVKKIYLDQTYYLGPGKGGEKPYHLLAEALKKTRLSALAQYNARGKQYLVLICPEEHGLVLEQLHYHHEVRDFSDIPVGSAKITQAELDLAVRLVQQSASKKFQPQKYEDSIRKRILGAIEKKVAGQEISETEAPPSQRIVDLMEALQASLRPQKSTRAVAQGPKPDKKVSKAILSPRKGRK